MKKLLALLLALVLTGQLVTPVLAETLPEETEAPVVQTEEPTQPPETEPPVPETEIPTEPATETPTTVATEAPETTEATETPDIPETTAATEVPAATDPTEETEAAESTESTDPTEETAETDLALLAQEDILASGNCGAEADGSNVTWVLTTDGTMILSGTGAAASYGETKDKDIPWYAYGEQILRVEVQKGITSVGGFRYCENLREVSLPEGLISLDGRAFSECPQLQHIELPKTLKVLGDGALGGCSLTEIELPEGLETLGDYALGSNKLTSLVIPASVTEMGLGVCENNDLEEVEIKANVPLLDRAFYECNSLRRVVISGSVQKICGYAFRHCYALREVVITGSVETIEGYSFSNLDSLERVQIDNGLKTLSNAVFKECGKLTTVSLPDGVTTIGESAFQNCVSLTTVNIPDSVTSIGADAFNGTKLSGKLNIPSSLTRIGDNAFYGCGNLTGTLVFPAAVESIGANAFADCKGIEEVILARGVVTIGEGAFNRCSGIRRLWFTNSVTTIGANAFSGLSSLEVLYFSGTDLDWDTGIAWARKSDREALDSKCKRTEEVASGDCGENLTWSLSTAGDLTVSGTGNMTDGAPWADYLNQIKLVTVGQGVTAIGSAAFQDCGNLEIVSLPNTLTAIGENAFRNCGKLTNMTLPTSLQTVGAGCFTGCDKLELLELTGVSDEIMAMRTSLEGTVTAPLGLKGAQLRWKLEQAGAIPPEDVAKISGDDAGGYYLERLFPGKVRLVCYDANSGAKGSKTVEFKRGTAILPQGVDTLTSGESLKLTAVTMPGGKEIEARWYLDDSAYLEYASLTRDGTLTAKSVDGARKISVTAYSDESEKMQKAFTILPQVAAVTLKYRSTENPQTLDIDLEGGSKQLKAETAPEDATNQVVWFSSDEKVARVENGWITPVSFGTAIITAQAADIGKQSASVVVNVRTAEPRLVSSTVSLNGASTRGATLELVESGSAIESVQLSDDRFTASYENGSLTIAPAQFVPKGTYPVTLTAACENGKTYDYALTVKVTVTLPKLTVKQEGKFNLFYSRYDGHSSAALVISGGQVEKAELLSEDFTLKYYDDRYWLDYSHEGVSEKPNTKATLSVLFKGYNTPVTKTITIATENKAPEMALASKTSVINTSLGGNLTVSTRLSGDTANIVYITWNDPNVDRVRQSENTIIITLKEAKNTTVNFWVHGYSWRHPVKLTHKITVTDKAPTLKLSSTKLTLNRVFPWMQAKADVTLNQGNLNGVRKMYFDQIPEGLRIEYNEYTDTIIVQSKDGETMPPKGKYTVTYRAQVVTWDVFELTGKLTINVEEKVPTVKLSSSTVKLNKRLTGMETATVKVSVSDPAHYSLTQIDNLPEGVTYDSSTGELTVKLTENTMNGGTFQLSGMKLLMDGLYPSAELDKPLTLKIQTYDKAPSFKLSAKGKLDVLNPDSEIVYTPKMTNCLNAPTAVKLTGDDAELFKASLDSEGKIHLTLAKSGEYYSTKTTYKVIPVLTACGQDITGSTLSVKVTQSAFKLAKLPNRTVFSTQSTALTQQLVVASPAGANIGSVALNAKTTAALREAVETAGGIGFDSQTGIVTVPPEGFTGLKPGKYTLILDVTPANAVPGTKPTQAKLTLTVQR